MTLREREREKTWKLVDPVTIQVSIFHETSLNIFQVQQFECSNEVSKIERERLLDRREAEERDMKEKRKRVGQKMLSLPHPIVS